MIFPELPRRYHVSTLNIVKTPLHEVEEIVVPQAVNVDEWFRQHGLATDPAAGSYTPRSKEPINWFARDAWEFYALCTAMTVWIVYWYGIHRGLW